VAARGRERDRALVLASCGEDGGTAAPGLEPEPTLGVADSGFGEILVNAEGNTLYAFTQDPDGVSVCYDECAANWPALVSDVGTNQPDDPRRDEDAHDAQIRTFLIADVRGYTLFTQERGDEAAAKLAAKFADITRDGIEAHGGTLLELRGDEALWGRARRGSSDILENADEASVGERLKVDRNPVIVGTLFHSIDERAASAVADSGQVLDGFDSLPFRPQPERYFVLERGTLRDAIGNEALDLIPPRYSHRPVPPSIRPSSRDGRAALRRESNCRAGTKVRFPKVDLVEGTGLRRSIADVVDEQLVRPINDAVVRTPRRDRPPRPTCRSDLRRKGPSRGPRAPVPPARRSRHQG